ncbi:MAG: hypothetical protein FWC89_02560 [Defluviitaleaceae bacterium]|nr:hypothetical protein [Defluviitaleaceae bacterium]
MLRLLRWCYDTWKFKKTRQEEFETAREKRQEELKAAREMTDDELYNFMHTVTVSYNCESAARQYLEIISQLWPVSENIIHSILRIAMRPIFYLGVLTADDMIDVELSFNIKRSNFTEWLANQHDLVELIEIELVICCILYDLKYDNEKNQAVLDHKIQEDMAFIFTKIQDREIYMEFQSFDEFKLFFYSLFEDYPISQNELDRLILEEEYIRHFLKQ